MIPYSAHHQASTAVPAPKQSHTPKAKRKLAKAKGRRDKPMAAR